MHQFVNFLNFTQTLYGYESCYSQKQAFIRYKIKK